MSGVIHFKRKAIFILCIPLLILVLVSFYHEYLFDTPSGQRRILQAELQERIERLDKESLKHISIFHGIPKRIVIFANEFSGYEYLENILMTLPGVYIHKPLSADTNVDAGDDRDWSIVSPEFREIIGNESKSSKVLPVLHCQKISDRKFSGSSQLLSEEVQHYCNENPIICSSEYFQRQLCRFASIQVLVLLNFDLNIGLLLRNLRDLHIVYMMRDPRAVAIEQTALNEGTCTNFTYCFEVAGLCKSINSNIGSVETFIKSRSRYFKIIRFEDLAYNLMLEMNLVFDSWGLKFTRSTYNVMSDLKPKIDNMTFNWDDNRLFKEVDEIQQKCGDVLHFFAYKVLQDQKELDLGGRTVNDLTSRIKTVEAENI